jgi:hypothetical protein
MRLLLWQMRYENYAVESGQISCVNFDNWHNILSIEK